MIQRHGQYRLHYHQRAFMYERLEDFFSVNIGLEKTETRAVRADSFKRSKCKVNPSVSAGVQASETSLQG